MKQIHSDVIQQALTFDKYLKKVTELVAAKKTSGAVQSDELAHFTKLNLHRMKRILKHQTLMPELLQTVEKVTKSYVFLTLTEAWCGDAAYNIPVIEKAIQQQPNIQLRFIFRDEHLDIMDAFLTNGGRSIPKVLVLSPPHFEVVTTWGPRPDAAQAEMNRLKEVMPPLDKMEIVYKIQEWYVADKSQSIQKELIQLFRQL